LKPVPSTCRSIKEKEQDNSHPTPTTKNSFAIPAENILMFDVYPNPFKDEVFIKSMEEGGNYKIKIMDALGRDIYSSDFKNNIKLNRNIFNDVGIYYVMIYSNDILFHVEKLVFNK
jgi:hypothetical protein